MNEFYEIVDYKSYKEDDPSELRLKNLGKQVISMIIGGRNGKSTRHYRDINAKDYDNLMAKKLIDCEPPYILSNILDHHLEYYRYKTGDKRTFLQQIRYVVLPIVNKKERHKVHEDLINQWLNEMEEKKQNKETSIELGNVNAPIQIQVNSDNSSQVQTVNYTNGDIQELVAVLRKDVPNLSKENQIELNAELDKLSKQSNEGKSIKGRLLTIGEFILGVGIGVFTNLISSPIYEIVKPHLGL